MKGNFQRAIWPLTAISALFGFALIEYPVGKPRRLLSLVYTIVPLAITVWLFFVASGFTEEDLIFQRSIDEAAETFCSVILVTIVCMTQWHAKRYCQCLDDINEIDETLSSLGCKDDFSKLRKVRIVILIVWVVWSLLLSTVDGSVDFEKKTLVEGIRFVFALVLLDAPWHISTVMEILFWFYLGYAGSRFDCINNLLGELAPDVNDSGWLRRSATTPIQNVVIDDERKKRFIWTMMHLHFRLLEVSRSITSVLQMQISLLAILSYGYVLISIIYTFRMILLPFEGDKVKTIAIIWVWSIAFFTKIVITNHMCERVYGKATSISNTTVNLLHTIDDKKMREDISLIILQAKHKPLRFSSLGLTYFGYKLMYQIFSSMVTVTVIILQMKTSLD